MNEPNQVMVFAAMDALREAGMALRRRGWPCELRVDRVVENDTYTVSLRVELPRVGEAKDWPIPVESVGSCQ